MYDRLAAVADTYDLKMPELVRIATLLGLPKSLVYLARCQDLIGKHEALDQQFISEVRAIYGASTLPSSTPLTLTRLRRPAAGSLARRWSPQTAQPAALRRVPREENEAGGEFAPRRSRTFVYSRTAGIRPEGD